MSRSYLRTIPARFERFMFGALACLQVHQRGQASPGWMDHRGILVLPDKVDDNACRTRAALTWLYSFCSNGAWLGLEEPSGTQSYW